MYVQIFKMSFYYLSISFNVSILIIIKVATDADKKFNIIFLILLQSKQLYFNLNCFEHNHSRQFFHILRLFGGERISLHLKYFIHAKLRQSQKLKTSPFYVYFEHVRGVYQITRVDEQFL